MPAEPFPSLTSDYLLALQQRLTHTLVSTAASHDVISLLVHDVTRALRAHSASISEVAEHATVLRRTAAVGYSSEALERWRDLPLQPGTPVTDAVLTLRAIYLTAQQWDAQYPYLATVRLPDMHVMAALPLVTSNRALGVLTLSWDERHTITPAEQAFLENLASQCAQTLERLTLHERQARQTQRLHTLLEFSSDILLVLDRDARVTYLSPSITLALGYIPDELLLLTLKDVLHPDDLAALQQQFALTLADPDRTLRAIFRVRHRHGAWITLELVGRNFLHDPTVRGVVCNARDVSQTVRALEAYRKSEQAQRIFAARYKQLLNLVTGLDSQTSPDDLIQAVLEHGLAVTDYAQAFYYDIADTQVTLRFARGEHIEAALAVLPRAQDLRQLGRSGQAILNREIFFAEANTPLMDPPEPLPRKFWRTFCIFPVVISGELHGSFSFVTNSENEVSEEHKQLMRGLADHVSVLIERRWHLQQLNVSREETLRAIGVALEHRDHETKGHTDRVVALTERLARALGIPDSDLDTLRWGAYLHDVGKIGTPDAILLKPGKLDAHEWEIMKRHPRVGYEMLAKIPSLPAETLAVVLHHHERWNGSGYPSGLREHDIPLSARIFAVVDVYDALTSARPYKAAWTHDAALAQLERDAGILLDPEVTRVFVKHASQIVGELMNEVEQ